LVTEQILLQPPQLLVPGAPPQRPRSHVTWARESTRM
jgi:hypothetical protein